MQEKDRAAQRTIRRSAAVALFLLLAFGFLLFRIFMIQYFDFERYQKKVLDQLTTKSPVRADRGQILDANGRVLAGNRTIFRVSVFPHAVATAEGENPGEKIAVGLSSRIAGLTVEKMREHLSHTGDLERTVARSVERKTADAILKFALAEDLSNLISVKAVSTRYYPYGTLASHVLGFTGSDGQGLYGLEYQYEEALAGVSGSYITARDSSGNALPNRYEAYVPATDGYTLTTTLDAFVQAALEKQLAATLLESGAKNRVCGIVMNVNTGAILGMATAPSFDLNDPFTPNEESLAILQALGLSEDSEEYRTAKGKLLLETWSNKAATEIYMPGSTFKTMTCSMVLEEKAVTNLDERFFCSGVMAVADRMIHCHKRGGHGSLTFTDGLQKSCNPVMMTISARIGCDCFYRYVSSFGMLEKTGIDLPGEGNSIFHAASSFTELDLATASFGQNFKVSVLQMITAVSAIANGGELLQPYLVEKMNDSAGNEVYRHERTVRRRVISEETAQTISSILAGGVAGDGGAKNAYVPGYRIAAKTGTSEKIGDDPNARIGSCVGYAPADDPQYAVIIVVDEPTDGSKYGSVVAAPYVAGVFSEILPYLGVEAVYTEQEEALRSKTVPDLTGLSREKAADLLMGAGFLFEFSGEGDTVTGQSPAVGSEITGSEAKILLTLGDGVTSEATVPNLIGMSASLAIETLFRAGFNLSVAGAKDFALSDKTVKNQFPAAGSVLPRGSVITLYFPFDEVAE